MTRWGCFATIREFLNKVNELWNSVPDSGGKASWSDDGGDNGETFWTVFVPDPGGGGGGLNVTYTRNGDGTITSNVSAAGSSGILYSTTILNDVEVSSAGSPIGEWGGEGEQTGPGSDQFHYFRSEWQAYNFMMEMQARDKVEISALMVTSKAGTGIMVQPWNDNQQSKSESATRGVYPGDYTRAVIKGNEYKIVGQIHTHPHGDSSGYEGPSGPGNSAYSGINDLSAHRATGWTMFIIGPSQVSLLNPSYPFNTTTWTDANYNVHTGNHHQIGTTQNLLNGNFSLFDYLH